MITKLQNSRKELIKLIDLQKLNMIIMKKLYLIFIIYSIFFNLNYSNAQLSDVITNINQPTSIFLDNNILYFGDYVGGLLKVDLSSGLPPKTILTAKGTFRTAITGNELYVVRWVEGTISKIDISQVNPTPIDIITNLNRPGGIAISGNDLYFSENVLNQICKIDISQTNPIKTVVVSTGLNNPSGLAINGNDLYIAEWSGNKISKIDITTSNPSPIAVITNLNNPTEVIINGDSLIVSEYSANKVITIDISNPTPVVSDLITNINQPTGLFINGTDLYISVFGDNKIVKFSSQSLGLQDLRNTDQKIKLFPNPASDFVTISGIEDNQNYSIFNNLGVEVLRGEGISNDNINIVSLTNGLYFLKLENKNIAKFIKQ